MFERFTERARQVVVLAQDEARALGHDYIGSEHILLGLLREQEGAAARVLESLNVTGEDVRAQVVSLVGRGEAPATGQIPFMPQAKRTLETSLQEALALGYNWIGPEHILLGLVHDKESVAARILSEFDADGDKIRRVLFQHLPERPSERERALQNLADAPRVSAIVVADDPGGSAYISEGRGRELAGVALRSPLTAGAVVAAVGFPLGLLVGWLIWG